MWSWRTLRGHSITFAALFACGVLGISTIATLRGWLTRSGAPWYIWLIVPGIIVTLIARKELQWVPNVAERRRWARRIFFGSIILSGLLAVFRPAPPPGDPLRPPPKPEPFHKVPR
jgi:hypothetical protein